MNSTASSSPMNRSGPSAPVKPPPPRTPPRWPRRSGHGSVRSSAPVWPNPHGSSTADPSRPPMWPRSWLQRMSTARSSAARASAAPTSPHCARLVSRSRLTDESLDETYVESDVEILNIILIALLVLTSIFLTLLILMHKGKGGGMSDMFGGGMSSSLGSSGVAERNLNRFTTLMAIVWAACIILLGILTRFNG